jgi:ATP-dependent DNA ligase
MFKNMRNAFEFCIPTRSTKVPHTPDGIHEIKYDGYGLRLERSDRVRPITRNGYDWTERYPWIVESALKNRQKQFVIDGEAIILGVDGYSDFNALQLRQAHRRSAARGLRFAGHGRRRFAKSAAVNAQGKSCSLTRTST